MSIRDCCAGQVSVAAYIGDQEGRGLQITSLSYVPEDQAVCLTTSTGHLLLLDVGTRIIEEVCGIAMRLACIWCSEVWHTQVGEVTGGIATASWSPDGEVFAVLTMSALLILMNKACF